MTILAGVTNRTSENSETASIHSVDKSIIHPNYSWLTLDCDVGFLWLKNPVSFRPTAKPITLAPVSERPKHGDILLATGWGLTEVRRIGLPNVFELSPFQKSLNRTYLSEELTPNKK